MPINKHNPATRGDKGAFPTNAANGRASGRKLAFGVRSGQGTRRKRPARKNGRRPLFAQALLIFILAALLTVLALKNAQANRARSQASLQSGAVSPSAGAGAPASPDVGGTATLDVFEPKAAADTSPHRLIAQTGIMAAGSSVSDYRFSRPIDMGLGSEYTSAQGIVTFRGNNFRDGGAYGFADIVGKAFSDSFWSLSAPSPKAQDGDALKGGWAGQPLIMTWPKETREHMNMYGWAKKADFLTEVIYPSEDGNVYFLDLTTGKKTRDSLDLGFAFKGSGSLDPRGYPILYLGSGRDSAKGVSHVFIVNLLDCSVMYEFGANDSFSLRGDSSFFNGSPLIDADTDRLVYPGGNGVIYIMDLNTRYDADAGTLSLKPSNTVKWRYDGTRATADSYLPGMEGSAVIWHSRLIIADTGGNLLCLSLKDLTLDWVQNTLDDTDCSPVLELEDGHPYIYLGTSFRAGWRASAEKTADVPVWKIDAVSGDIVWKMVYTCHTGTEVSGGVQGTAALGKNKLSDLIFVPVAMTPESGTGILAALSKKTGETVWQQQTQVYSRSSPVAVYDRNGNGYLVFCTAGGYMYLLDGLTGKVLDFKNLGSVVDASPAVFNGTVVVGTSGRIVYGIKLT